jgi:hypothetical protein
MIPKYKSEEYWKSADEYQFDVDDGGKLSVYAHSPRIARLKATNWEKWLKKTNRGNDKVIKGSLVKKTY